MCLNLWLVALGVILKKHGWEKKVRREIYAASGFESRAWKVYGEDTRLGFYYTGWVRCLGCGRKRKGDCIQDGPGEAGELPRVQRSYSGWEAEI